MSIREALNEQEPECPACECAMRAHHTFVEPDVLRWVCLNDDCHLAFGGGHAISPAEYVVAFDRTQAKEVA